MTFLKLLLDTDSLFLAICGQNLEEIVKPEKLDDWETNIKHKWFADNTPAMQKEPGYLKSEKNCTRGSYCGLSAK